MKKKQAQSEWKICDLCGARVRARGLKSHIRLLHNLKISNEVTKVVALKKIPTQVTTEVPTQVTTEVTTEVKTEVKRIYCVVNPVGLCKKCATMKGVSGKHVKHPDNHSARYCSECDEWQHLLWYDAPKNIYYSK